jgi:hypothetical protein
MKVQEATLNGRRKHSQREASGERKLVARAKSGWSALSGNCTSARLKVYRTTLRALRQNEGFP